MNEKKQKSKLKLVFIFFIIFSIFIFAKNFNLSISNKIDPETYTNKSKTPRGIIYDSKMRELAINIPTYTIYLDKEIVSNRNETVTISNVSAIYQTLPNILNITPSQLEKKLSKNRRTVMIAQSVDINTYNQILEVKSKYGMRSVYGVETFKRFYPYSDIFGHIIGYMNKTETEGYTGLEATYESILSSDNDNPRNIILTLDRDVQTIVRNELLKTVAEMAVQSATVIISDVNTGAILANYSYPSFDPNNPFIYGNHERMDRSIKSTVYPGSTMKTFILTAALETGVATIDETFNCKGYYDYSEQTRVSCDRPHGIVNGFEDILKYSCNYAIISIAERIDKKFLYDYLKRFGFGDITGVGPYKDEWSGIYHPLRKWHNYSRGYLAIGYDLSTTPMQIAASYLPLFNGGVKVPMHIVGSIYNNNIRYDMSGKEKRKQIIGPQYSQVAKYVLQHGVSSGSTGAKANLVNIDVVGKTGTAITEVIVKTEDGGERIEKYYQSSFVGGFPMEEPKVSILVLFDGPETSSYRGGGSLAAPLFAKIALQIIPYLGLTDNIVYTINTNDFKTLIPRYNIRAEDTMPDILGVSLRDALNIISPSVLKHNAKIAMQGEGYITDYLPRAGEAITNNQVFYLKLEP